MTSSKILKVLLAIFVGELILILATTFAQEVLFDGISLASPWPTLIAGGLATFLAAVLAGYAARFIIKEPIKIVAIVISLLIVIETSYLISGNKTADPVWFDSLAGISLVLGVWIGFYAAKIYSTIRLQV